MSESMNIERFSPVKDVLRTKIITDPGRFQGRETDFSSDTVKAIVAKGYYDRSASPIKVWWDDLKDKYVVLAGHSRLAAWDRIHTRYDLSRTIPVIVFQGDEDDAMDYAIIESNRKSTEEGLASDLRAYRRAVESGKSKKYLLSVFKPESKLAKLQKLMQLNPKGRFIEMLSGASALSFPYLDRNAQWVGDMRSQLPQLSDAHELELFKYIYDGGKGLKLDKAQLYKVVNDRVNRIDFDPTAALNLENRVSSNAYVDPINEEIANVTKEIERSKKEIDDKRATIVRAKEQFGDIKKGEGYKLTSPIFKRIDDLNRFILRKIEEREKLKQQAGRVERTVTADLFSEPEAPKTMSKKTEFSGSKPKSIKTGIVFHGGKKVLIQSDLTNRIMYFSDDREFSEYYSTERSGVSTPQITEATLVINNLVPAKVVEDTATRLGYDIDAYGTAQLLDNDDVRDAILKLGYDGGYLMDYGFRSDFEQIPVYVVLNAAKSVTIVSPAKNILRTPVKRWDELEKGEVVIIDYGGAGDKPYALKFRSKGNFVMKNGRIHPHSTVRNVYKPLPSDQYLVNELIEATVLPQFWNEHAQYKPVKKGETLQDRLKKLPEKVEQKTGNYYVTNVFNDNLYLLLGPFNAHQDAIRSVQIIKDHVINVAQGNDRKQAVWGGYGTTNLKTGTDKGTFNDWFAENHPQQTQPLVKRTRPAKMQASMDAIAVSPGRPVEEGGVSAGENVELFRGGHELTDAEIKTDGISLTKSEEIGKYWASSKVGGRVFRYKLSKAAKILTDIPKDILPKDNPPTHQDKERIVTHAKAKGYDGVDLSGIFSEQEVRIFNSKAVEQEKPEAPKIEKQAQSKTKSVSESADYRLPDDFDTRGYEFFLATDKNGVTGRGTNPIEGKPNKIFTLGYLREQVNKYPGGKVYIRPINYEDGEWKHWSEEPRIFGLTWPEVQAYQQKVSVSRPMLKGQRLPEDAVDVTDLPSTKKEVKEVLVSTSKKPTDLELKRKRAKAFAFAQAQRIRILSI